MFRSNPAAVDIEGWYYPSKREAGHRPGLPASLRANQTAARSPLLYVGCYATRGTAE